MSRKSGDAGLTLAQVMQRSEGRRAQLLLAVLAAVAVLLTVRHLVDASPADGMLFWIRPTMVVIAMVYAVWVLRLTRRADREGRVMPSWFWLGTTIVESMLPTVNVIELMTLTTVDPHLAMTSPGMTTYFVIVIISVLRLRPMFSVIGGVSSGVQHAVVVGMVLWREESAALLSMKAFYFSYSVMIALAGVCAGVVSAAIRTHVLAGMREVATRAELAEVRHDLDVARRIQQQLLPAKPIEVCGFEIAGWNLPADQTGGDYYDWMPLPSGRVAVAIADVSGHGIGPALLMAVCRAYARASVPSVDGLSKAVARLNELVSQDLSDGRFITFAAAVLSADEAGVQLLSAGHGPTLVYHRKSGEVELFGGDGMPLGVEPEAVFGEPRRLVMETGDILMLVTDGFTEAQNAKGEQFGAKRLAESLKRHSQAASEEVLPMIERDVRAFMDGERQQDDMTAVIVRRASQIA